MSPRYSALGRIIAVTWPVRSPPFCGMRNGFTLIELAIALVVVGIVVGLASPRIIGYADRAAVRRAGDETAAFFSRVRTLAVYRAVRMRISFGGDSLIALAEGEGDSIVSFARGPNHHGVSLAASRSEIRLYPNGLGLGAANTKLVFRRGEAADSLTISRLGRLRRWP